MNVVYLVLLLGTVDGDVRYIFLLYLFQIDYDVIWEVVVSCDI